MKRPITLFSRIAREHLLIPTLKRRKSDSLDFHDVAVWQVEAALKAAFEAGIRSSGMTLKPQNVSKKEPVSGGSQSPLIVPRGTALMPGRMYLRLYHGRIDPEQNMDEWGFDGPTFGPLSCYVHTYCCTFRFHSECDTSEIWLEKHADMIQWDGCFYGDMEVFIAKANDRA